MHFFLVRMTLTLTLTAPQSDGLRLCSIYDTHCVWAYLDNVSFSFLRRFSKYGHFSWRLWTYVPFRTQSRIEVILTISVYFYNTCHTRTADFSALTHPQSWTCMSHASRPWTWDRMAIHVSNSSVRRERLASYASFLFFFSTLLFSLGSLLHACPPLCLSNFKVDRKNHARFGGPKYTTHWW